VLVPAPACGDGPASLHPPAPAACPRIHCADARRPPWPFEFACGATPCSHRQRLSAGAAKECAMVLGRLSFGARPVQLLKHCVFRPPRCPPPAGCLPRGETTTLSISNRKCKMRILCFYLYICQAADASSSNRPRPSGCQARSPCSAGDVRAQASMCLSDFGVRGQSSTMTTMTTMMSSESCSTPRQDHSPATCRVQLLLLLFPLVATTFSRFVHIAPILGCWCS